MMSCDKEQKGPSVHSDVVWSHDFCAVFKGEEDCLLCLWMQAHTDSVSPYKCVCVCVCLLFVSEGDQVRAGGYVSLFPQWSVFVHFLCYFHLSAPKSLLVLI